MKSKNLLVALVAIAALAGGIAIQLLNKAPLPQFSARVFDPVRIIKPFELTDQYGNTINNDIFSNKWTLLFLGYTHCPDVCPTTLAKLAGSYKNLSQAGIDNLQVMFVSVDPQRDDSARLKEYTDYFNPKFVAASGPHKALFPFVRNLGLMYSMTQDTSLAEYAVDHSAGIALINPHGQLQAMFKPVEALGQIPTVDMSLMESDLKLMVKHL